MRRAAHAVNEHDKWGRDPSPHINTLFLSGYKDL